MGQEIVLSARDKANKNLIPFTGGPDARRYTGGRPAWLDIDNNLDLFCKAYATGIDTKELSDIFNISERSVRDYKKDPRVIRETKKLMEERVREVVRKTDSQIHTRLRAAEHMTLKELLEIRKEFLGGLFRQETEGGKDDPDTINAAQRALETNPELAAEMSNLMERLGAQPEKVSA